VNDVKEMLSLALDTGPAAGTPADPREDLARGRRLLRRRRMLAATGVAAAMAVGAVVPFALQNSAVPVSHGLAGEVSRPTVRAAKPKAQAAAEPAAQGGVKLVAWRGTQPPGYQVSWMPSGWVVQGSTPFALVIAPAADTNTSPDNFAGKLTVMLQSASASSPPPGAAQPVNGRPGVFESAKQAGGDTEILDFKNANGKWVWVQAPMSLGWDSAQLAQFCGGVTVLAAAQQGVG
jgi:hypothetical protein